MKTAILVENPRSVQKYLDCGFTEVRIGSEFCENKISTLDDLIKCCTELKGKNFSLSFCYPRLSTKKISLVESHLHFLSANFPGCQVVTNDFGLFPLVKSNNLNIQIGFGRQLFSVPHRAHPSMEKVMGKETVFKKLAFRFLFSQTSLNYKLTIKFLKKIKVSCIDFDFLPETFKNLKVFNRKGFGVNIHVGVSLTALTRKCHLARYLDISTNKCSADSCRDRSLILDHKEIGTLRLVGNALLDYRDVTKQDISTLQRSCKPIFVIDENWLALKENRQIAGALFQLQF